MKKSRWLLAAMFALFALISASCGTDDADSDDPGGTDADDGMDDANDGMDGMDDADGAMDDANDGKDGMDDADGAMDDMIKYDYGVDYENRVIRVGLNTDLTGIFSPLVAPVADGQKVYWEWLNDNGGIQGWTVEPVILDSGYEVPKHLENYDIMAGDGEQSVVMFSTSVGSPHTAATAERLVEDQIAAVPLSWYSGWTDPEIGQNVFETLASYCVESMNGATYMAETYGDKVAVVSYPGDYGEDAAKGVKVAAEALGLEIVYDGQGAAVPGADLTSVIASIVQSGADWVWLATSAREAATLIGGAAAQGFTGQWAATGSAWHPFLLSSGVSDIVDKSFTLSYYANVAEMNSMDEVESQGMRDMRKAMSEYRPEAPFLDTYVISWIQGLVTTQILDAAISDGDITRAGVLAAARSVTVDLQGLGPDQSWSGEPDDNVVRGTYIYDVDKSLYTPGKTISDMDAHNGLVLIKGPYASDTAADWIYEPCFRAS